MSTTKEKVNHCIYCNAILDEFDMDDTCQYCEEEFQKSDEEWDRLTEMMEKTGIIGVE